jgi:hypothetical protein
MSLGMLMIVHRILYYYLPGYVVNEASPGHTLRCSYLNCTIVRPIARSCYLLHQKCSSFKWTLQFFELESPVRISESPQPANSPLTCFERSEFRIDCEYCSMVNNPPATRMFRRRKSSVVITNNR